MQELRLSEVLRLMRRGRLAEVRVKPRHRSPYAIPLAGGGEEAAAFVFVDDLVGFEVGCCGQSSRVKSAQPALWREP